MNAIAEMREAFDSLMPWFFAQPALRLVQEKRLTIPLYCSALREIYHYTKEDPQMQAYAATFFRGDDRELVPLFFRHALSEVGHEKLALADLVALGESADGIAASRPLPATIAFTAFGFYQIAFGNPISYLGYLYFLEMLPTQHGSAFREALMHAGVPESALTFLRDHMTIDVGHNKLMEQYLSKLVRNRADLDAAIYTLQVSASLYAQLLQGAFERDSISGFSPNHDELARMPTSFGPPVSSFAA